MVTRQLDINVGDKNSTLFLTIGFFDYSSLGSAMHKHKLTEVQIVVKGSGYIMLGGEKIKLNENEMLVIPNGTFHRRISFDKDAQIITFQTTENISKCIKRTLKPYFVDDFKKEIELYLEKGESLKLAAFLQLICAEFVQDANDMIEQIEDRKFIIYEYFSLNYHKNITLSDLSLQLCLSKKQTQRLLIKYTGETFKKNLTKFRIEAATSLMTEQNKSLSEIAEAVGYKSYSGFWKAYKTLVK